MRTAACLPSLLVVSAARQSTPAERERATRVEAFGPGRFTVSYGSLWGSSSARTAAIRDANQHCATDGQVMLPIEETTSMNNFTRIFSCAPNSQP